MKIEKYHGSFRVRIMRSGKSYNMTFEHKPTKAQIEEYLSDLIQKSKQNNGPDMTMKTACERYTESKSNVLSPSTIKDYALMPGRFPQWFLDTKICDVTQDTLNKFVNELALNKSAKTIKNYHGFVSAVLGTYRPNFAINTHLPMRIKKEPYIPTDEEVKAILQDVKGKPFECALCLMCFGLRRSEALAVQPEDIEDGVVHVSKALVQNKEKEWVINDLTKTVAGTRDVPLPSWLCDKIKEQGYIFKGHPNTITKYLYSVEKRLGFEIFSVHKLRHYFASSLHEMGIPDADIMALGGWKSDTVMKTVYRHSKAKEEKKKDIADKYNSMLFN